MPPAYMGWRTMRYGPSVATWCARSLHADLRSREAGEPQPAKENPALR
jgi:hypothetical protein